MSIQQTIRFSILAHQLGKVTSWRSERIAKLQHKRLRRLVRFAVERSPYYREKYRGIDLRRFELDQLSPTSKEEIRTEFDRVVTDRRIRRSDAEGFMADSANLGRWYLGRYAVSHTSGSQGPPLLIIQDRRCLEIMFAIATARANTVGSPTIAEGIRRLMNPARVAVIALHRSFYPSAAAFEFMPELVGRYVQLLWLSSQQPDLIERLNQFQPNLIVAYSSVLEALALQAAGLRLTQLHQITNSSEQLSDRARKRIETAFQVPVLDHYGAGECLLLSDGCLTEGGAHVNMDWAILEVVDDHNKPVPAGELGAKILVTNLANTVQPFIRYEIGDRLAISPHPCRCGRPFAHIERIEGRNAELFWVEDGNHWRFVSGVLLHSAVDALREIREWQAIQRERNRIDFLLELLPGATLSAEVAECHLVEKLVELGLPERVAIHARIVRKLAADQTTGKFRRMISYVGPPADARICGEPPAYSTAG
jgi:phenylacetate-CoA ligase